MNLFKRCACAEPTRCRHPYHYLFWLDSYPHRGSTRTRNHKLAGRIAAKRQIAALEGREGLTRVKPVRLSEHVKAYLAHTARTNRTSYKDKGVLEGLVESVGDRALTEVSAFHVERWKSQRAEKVGRSTVNRELNIIRGCFSRALDWGRLTASPLRRVKPYRVDDARLRVCTPDEIRRLLEGAPTDLKLLARLTLESLPRLSEGLGLRSEDLGPDSVTIVRGKGGRRRVVPLSPELQADLLARCHASGYVFGRGPAGRPPRAAAVSVAFARLSKSLGLTGISHHTLRHTGATVMVANGVSLRAVQAIGGWTTLRMVERYAHVDDAELRRAVRITHNHTEQSTIANPITATATPSSKKSS